MMKTLLRLSLLVGLGLFAAACAPQGSGAPAATVPPVTIQAIPTATLVPLVPQGEPLTVGFNVRGWT